MNYPKPEILTDLVPQSAIGKAWYISVPEYSTRQVTELLQVEPKKVNSVFKGWLLDDDDEHEDSWIAGLGPSRSPRINNPNPPAFGSLGIKDKFLFFVLLGILGILAFGIYKHVREKLRP